MNTITDILYWISTGLLVPVIILLIFLFIKSLITIGTFFAHYQAIRKNGETIHNALKNLDATNIFSIDDLLPEKSNLLVTIYIRKLLAVTKSETHTKHILANFEIEAEKELSKSKMLAKIGPILGLMGTLIPMGPALVGLATGDIASLAYNMQVAFATTVVGLFIGAIGFVTQQTKQRWYVQDITNLEFIANLLNEKQK